MQKARSQSRCGRIRTQPPTACGHVVSGPLSLPAQGCFSPVPHGTRSLSVTRESLALEGGPPSFTPDFSCRALLRNSATSGPSRSPTGLSPSLASRSRELRLPSPDASVGPTTPRAQGPRFGLNPVRSPLLGASRLISLPPGTEMFQFPGFASVRRLMTVREDGRVSPFGHLGLAGCVRLPRAFRSLPRPSSPPCAQASPTCLRSLDYNIRQAEHALSRIGRKNRFAECSCAVPHSPNARRPKPPNTRRVRIHIPRSTSFLRFSNSDP